ncbi:AAA domain-containing protein [Desmospora activa]|uniref:AAA domain-containing protein n=1 Tax=Desmospora activa TaxID=500615 RepID=UPI001474D00E|nr:AAA domain-containing protein [Desmospora activa]
MDEEVEFHICPVFLERADDPDEIFTPIFLPAQLEEAKLLPISHQLPYIPRKHLEPTIKDNLALGSLEKLDEFIAQNPYTVDGNWKQAIRYAKELFMTVNGSQWDDFSVDSYRASKEVWMAVKLGGTKNKLIHFYEELITSSSLPPLLKNYLSLDENEKRPLLDSTTYSNQHLGQMNKAYPLSRGQRESLQHFLALNEGEMLAVNGPPGTGKTTLLQNVVATLWVKAAINGDEDPPVIVATSANNKAITNIIDSFAKDDDGAIEEGREEPLRERWLPDLKSFGLYLPSNTKMEELNKKKHPYHIVSQNGENFMKEMEKTGRHTELESHFLHQYSNYAGHSVDNIQQAVKQLHQDLVQVQRAIDEGAQLAVKHRDQQKRLKDDFSGSVEGLIQYQREWEQKVEAAESRRKPYVELKKKWNEYCNQEPFWWNWFAFLPGIKARRIRRNESFVLDHSEWIEVVSCTENEVTAAIDEKLNKMEGIKQEAFTNSEEATQLQEEIKATKNQIQKWRSQYGVEEEDIIAGMDTTLRYTAFMLATHYWEGKWLLEIEHQIQQRYNESKSSQKTMKKWRRYAKLTPCFVSTFYKLPDWFCGFDPRVSGSGTERVYLSNFIDVLIIDEVGQAPPGLAAPAFAFAKKSLVVGDIMQIEPITSITRGVDQGNLFGSRVIGDWKNIESIEEKGVTTTAGSAMKIAQRRSSYMKVAPFGGMFLDEHRRCVPEIIGYCNLLAYEGGLTPKRNSRQKYSFIPHMGYAHIESKVKEAKGLGKFNLEEAESIALWIQDHAEEIINISGKKKVEESVGIVTPFRYQTVLIQRFLRELGFKDITVGTVHALQGAEKDIILFSPVVGAKNRIPFYDRNPNMLNVAVSRAKDSFLVFGNMEEFGLVKGAPSHLLRSFIYKEENEVVIRSGQSKLLGRVAERIRTSFDGNRYERTVIQQIIQIQSNDGQIIFSQGEGSVTATQTLNK